MSNNIFILHDNDGLIPLLEQEYESEAIFQALLTDYPELLLFSDERTPYSNLLLIKQEHGVPIEANGGAYYFLDHLFVDLDGTLTLIEVKRKGDTRSRREVIAQLLDYVTNGLAFWTIDDLRHNFIATYREKNQDPDEVIQNFLGDDIKPEQFWLQVESNLRNERIRMVYVADEISQEMRRIVSFLNRQMKSASIYAIELRQFVGNGVKAFIPDVIGAESSESINVTKSKDKKQWDENSFFEELTKNNSDVVPVAKAILDWGKKITDDFFWGKGYNYGSFAPAFEHNGVRFYPGLIFTYGNIEIQFKHLKKLTPFQSEELRRKLLDRLNQIPGVSISDKKIDARPSIPLKLLMPEKSLEKFLDILQWTVDEIKHG